MLELLYMSLLGTCYVCTRIYEKKAEEIEELKIIIFCYAVRHHLLYSNVIEKIRNKEITIEEIKKEGKN